MKATQSIRVQTVMQILWLTVINCALVLLVCSRYFRHFEPADQWLRFIYVPTAIMGYAFVGALVWLFFCAVLGSWPRLVHVLSVVFYTACLVFLVADTVVYDVYRFHINAFFLSTFFTTFSDFGLSYGTVAAIFAIPVVLVAAQALLLRWVVRRTTIRPMRRRTGLVVTGVMLSCFAVGQLIHAWAFENNYFPVTSITPHLPLYFPVRAHNFMVKVNLGGVDFAGQADAEANGGGNSTRAILYPLHPLEYRPVSTNYNILIILLESWRFDMMNEQVTPNLFELAKKSCVFDRHYSGGSVTTTGMFTLFYGLAPTYWAVVGANPSAIGPPILLEEARRLNYQFLLLATTEMERFKIVHTVFKANRADLHVDTKGLSWKRDAKMTDRFLEFLRTGRDPGRPFFGMVFYRSPHYNYYYPPDYPEQFKPTRLINYATTSRTDDPAPYRNRYKNAIRYADAEVGKVLKEVQSAGLMDNTIIIVTSDHGEEFNENGDNYWGHGSNFTRYQIQTPLIVYWPGRPPQHITRETSHVDIPPTLISEVFGCNSAVEYYSSGRSLFDDSQRPGLMAASYVNYAYIVNGFVYALYPGYVKKHGVEDIWKPAPDLSPAVMKYFFAEQSRFRR